MSQILLVLLCKDIFMQNEIWFFSINFGPSVACLPFFSYVKFIITFPMCVLIYLLCVMAT